MLNQAEISSPEPERFVKNEKIQNQSNRDVDFVDFLAGTCFRKIMLWTPHSAIPVEIVEVVTGTDNKPPLPFPGVG
jgi:hypothetical protein